jgi:hypothetical protein
MPATAPTPPPQPPSSSSSTCAADGHRSCLLQRPTASTHPACCASQQQRPAVSMDRWHNVPSRGQRGVLGLGPVHGSSISRSSRCRIWWLVPATHMPSAADKAKAFPTRPVTAVQSASTAACACPCLSLRVPPTALQVCVLQYDAAHGRLSTAASWVHPEEVWDVACCPGQLNTFVTVHKKSECAVHCQSEGMRLCM